LIELEHFPFLVTSLLHFEHQWSCDGVDDGRLLADLVVQLVRSVTNFSVLEELLSQKNICRSLIVHWYFVVNACELDYNENSGAKYIFV
jgi:hypothetical protein